MKAELLCPAGDSESMKAAIYAGCDAVYLGGTKYSARAYASNFTDEELEKTIKYAHLYGVKVYITINTLLKNNEIIDAYNYAVNLWNLGADAIIIQDLGLIYLLRKYNPDIELHASTQMTIHNYLGAKYAHFNLGLKRLVLARELSLPEIKEISKDFETEIFIHGALCISYSGKCLMSSLLSGRSGNRGRCSQNCRMRYRLLDSFGKSRGEGFLLSPKDINTIDIIDKIKETGTSSLKIEGRMKRKEYVFETANQYRKKLDGFDTEEKNIAQLFNREGFSKAFMLGNDGKDMMSYSSSKNTGLLLGQVKGNFITLRENIRLGDGVGNKNEGFFITKITDFRNREIKEAKANERVKLYPVRYKENDTLYKTSDQLLIKNINKRLEEKYPYKIPVNIECFFKIGEKLKVSAFINDIKVSSFGDIVEKPLNSPISEEKLKNSLSKSGDTPFVVGDITLDYEEGFIPVSRLNEVRREVLEKLEVALTSNKHNEKITDLSILEKDILVNINLEDKNDNFKEDNSEVVDNKKSNTYVIVSKNEQVEAVLKEDYEICFYPFYKNKEFLKFKDIYDFDSLNIKYYVKLPTIIKKELDIIVAFLKKLKNLKGVITDNFAIFEAFKNSDLEIITDYKMNIFNNYAKKNINANKFTMSYELSREEMMGFSTKDDFLVTLFSNDEMMISEYCSVGSIIGGKTKCKECAAPCINENYLLQDDKKENFKIMTDIFCRSYIINGRKRDLLDRKNELIKAKFRNFRIDLLDENKFETEEILRCFKESKLTSSFTTTRGNYKKSIL